MWTILWSLHYIGYSTLQHISISIELILLEHTYVSLFSFDFQLLELIIAVGCSMGLLHLASSSRKNKSCLLSLVLWLVRFDVEVANLRHIFERFSVAAWVSFTFGRHVEITFKNSPPSSIWTLNVNIPAICHIAVRLFFNRAKRLKDYQKPRKFKLTAGSGIWVPDLDLVRS